MKEKKENYISYLETAIHAEDFKTIKNIEGRKQTDLFKSATNAIESIEINDKITIEDWTIDDADDKNKKNPSYTKEYINDILEKTITKNN